MNAETPTQANEIQAFTFGEPTPVLSGRDYLDMFDVMRIGDYLEPPIPPKQIAKAYGANQHHASAIQVKRNILVSCYEPHPLLSVKDFKKAALNYLVFGNAYLEDVRNRLGRTMKLRAMPSLPIRRMMDPEKFMQLMPGGARHEFKKGSIIHLIEDDIKQEIYGEPAYMSALQSILLNEASTLFRRKYYENGSHAGFILYMTDPGQSQHDVKAMQRAMRDAKGPGNFKNLFVYSPGGDKDGLKIMPISEVAAKDEFLNIKNVTRDDVLAMHRVPPQMMGIIPGNVGGFGDVEKAARVFVRNELEVLQAVFLQINEEMGQEIVKFKPYSFDSDQEG